MKAILNWTMFVAVTILYWFVLAHLPGNVEALKLVATVADVILIIKVFADDDVVGGLWATCLAALVVATVYYFTVLIGYTSVLILVVMEEGRGHLAMTPIEPDISES